MPRVSQASSDSTRGSSSLTPTGCPVSANAAAFDVFEGPYQLDPADAMRWSRAKEPIFFSPKLGYWVVSRYDDVKAVFRDSGAFSPSNALEKMTPTCLQAQAILDRYDYRMNRTLVNEDEPAHMQRRRLLMKSFESQELARHEPMVRKLTREYVDRFIDRGEVDLVEAMLWEIPLTVALHFLGVPEEDVQTLRSYSIAHTVNTWGRPTPDQQVAVAEAVGQFWQYAGEVLEKMRRDPSGPGWMEYAIRQQRQEPEVVTDSYLHSMMMAGIVAAHETTAHASANALRLLLQNRSVWRDICAEPGLIPHAVEECLRMAGSIVAWRRIALLDTRIGDTDIPKGSKILIVTASANQDERHFENACEFDLQRSNTSDHLTFGYGSHQCMGKNLARMEMRIFLEELTRRLPHMELVPDQSFSYLPNVSFRGPDHLNVRWDPESNPEKLNPQILRRHLDFAIGAPARNRSTRKVRAIEIATEANQVARIVLEDPMGRDLPAWTAGAHIEVIFEDYVRQYSLCGKVDDSRRYVIAVLKEAAGRGGSDYLHHVRPGDILQIRGPKNHFRLDEQADRYLLLAGGIGITPIIAMADRLRQLGKPFALHYTGRSHGDMAFLSRLRQEHGTNFDAYQSQQGERLELEAVIAAHSMDTQIYACGPERFLAAVQLLTSNRPGRLGTEHFSASRRAPDQDDRGFDVELSDSRMSLHVPPEQSLLQALRSIGIDVPSDCEEGLCGTCEVEVLAGEVEHRDRVLTAAERSSDLRMMSCCSRARGKKLVLAI